LHRCCSCCRALLLCSQYCCCCAPPSRACAAVACCRNYCCYLAPLLRPVTQLILPTLPSPEWLFDMKAYWALSLSHYVWYPFRSTQFQEPPSCYAGRLSGFKLTSAGFLHRARCY
jgi:hypothetical protein